jgi:GNAT superfamily N-acetyltransferase
MKFLIDTNVFIPLEPTMESDVESLSGECAHLYRELQSADHDIFLHPASQYDIDRDKNQGRKKLRKLMFHKYRQLPDPPSMSSKILQEIGVAEHGTNDWVDHMLLTASICNAVHVLVTEDQKLHKKARRLGVESKVATVSEALGMLSNLYGNHPRSTFVVEGRKLHSVSLDEMILNSLRDDYGGFDAWYEKAQLDHRDCFVVRDINNKRVSAIAILKSETSGEYGLGRRVLKICTLKVDDEFGGLRYGELLLQSVFQFAYEKKFSRLYVTVFPKHKRLMGFLESFGFFALSGTETSLREKIYVKELVPSKEVHDLDLFPFDYHVKYGPKYFSTANVNSFIVPIKPKYHRILFPELDSQGDLFSRFSPCGNAIRKAYLCRANSRAIRPGDLLFFYRSNDSKEIDVLGVAEDVLASVEAEEIAGFVGKRTVYDFSSISEMCSKGEVLSILFRYSQPITPPVTYDELMSGQVINGPVQQLLRIDMNHAHEVLEGIGG